MISKLDVDTAGALGTLFKKLGGSRMGHVGETAPRRQLVVFESVGSDRTSTASAIIRESRCGSSQHE
jgi:hypothetical protein